MGWEDRGEVEIRLAGRGRVSLEELEARFAAYMNAGAPEPVLEGSPEEKRSILREVRGRGDGQMRALVDLYLKREEPDAPQGDT
jgi:hypothetical protein